MDVNVVAFSDTHNKHKQITLPECDIAICAGDITSVGQKHELESFLEWFNKQTQCTERIFIAGNHDRCFDPKFGTNEWLKPLLNKYNHLTYLEDSGIETFGLKIWGSPWTPWFHGDYWAFNKYRGDDIDQIWKRIPFGTDILVTHGPPAYILDYVEQDKAYAGCENLRFRVEEIKPKIHTFGHIHLESGRLERKVEDYKDTTYINASVLNNAYTIIAEPVKTILHV